MNLFQSWVPLGIMLKTYSIAMMPPSQEIVFLLNVDTNMDPFGFKASTQL